MDQSSDLDFIALKCTDHGDQALCYCEKCNIPVCIKCVTGKHKGHNMVEFDKVLQEEKNLLQSDIDRIENTILPKLIKWREDVTSNKETIENSIQQITKDMEDENQCIQNEINRTHHERMECLDRISHSKSTILDGSSKDIDTKISFYKVKLCEFRDLIEKNSLLEILSTPKRKQPFPNIGCKPTLQEPPVFVSGNMHSVTENLGKLHACSTSSVDTTHRSFSTTFVRMKSLPLLCSFLVVGLACAISLMQLFSSSSLFTNPLTLTTPTIESKFRSPLVGWPSLFITKEGDVWLGGAQSYELVMVDIKGQILRRRNIGTMPMALAVMDNGDIIISPSVYSGSSSVIRLLKDDRVIVIDTSGRGLLSVSVTVSQKILIISSRRVLLANADGSNKRQIYKGSRGVSVLHAVESIDGKIYISDWIKSVIVIVNEDGHILSTLTHTTGGKKLRSPFRLVVDSIGNVLCADTSNHVIYIIDQNQQVMELVGIGIQHPGWLAVDSNHNLWVTQRDGTVHIVKYLSR